ncbi:hypothetical protein Efla_001549 [Eimeria flavescens]
MEGSGFGADDTYISGLSRVGDVRPTRRCLTCACARVWVMASAKGIGRHIVHLRAFAHDSVTPAACFLLLSVAAAAEAIRRHLLLFQVSLSAVAVVAAAAVVWTWALRRIAEGYRLPASLHPLSRGPLLFRNVEGLVSFLCCSPQQQQQQQQHMKGKVCVITGANSGIGTETALQLAAWGARLALLCRSEAEGEALARRIHRQQQQQQQQQGEGEDGSKCGSACKDGCVAKFIHADLCSLQSLRAAAAAVEAFCSSSSGKGIDVLIHNAGVWTARAEMVADLGVERMFATHVVGPYALTRLLQQQLHAAAGRVIFVSSLAQHHAAAAFKPEDALDSSSCRKWGLFSYHNSKLAEMWLAAALQREFSSSSSSSKTGPPAAAAAGPPMVLTVHPGVVDTKLPRNLQASSLLFRMAVSTFRLLLLKTAAQGAATVLLLAAAPKDKLKDGGYYAEGELGIVDPRAGDIGLQDATLQLCKKVTSL